MLCPGYAAYLAVFIDPPAVATTQPCYLRGPSPSQTCQILIPPHYLAPGSLLDVDDSGALEGYRLVDLGAHPWGQRQIADQTVVPGIGAPASSTQRNDTPPHSCTSMPRCVLYQAQSALGSFALIKIPPIPVTRFILASFPCASMNIRNY